MGVKFMGASEATDVRCAYCGNRAKRPVKIRSHEDAKTVRICREHYEKLATAPRAWDEFTALNFPKWGLKCYGREWYDERGLTSLVDAKAKAKGKGKRKR